MQDDFKEAAISNDSPPLTLADLWNIVQRGRKTILLCMMAVIGLGIVYSALATRKYLATAEVLIENSERNTQMEVVTPTTSVNDLALVPSQIQVLTSRELMRSVLNDLGMLATEEDAPATPSDKKQLVAAKDLIKDEEAKNTETPPVRTASAPMSIDYALKNLDASQVEKSRAIEISYRSPNPQLAADIVNKLTENYIGQQMDWRFKTINNTNTWLRNRVRELQQEIRKKQNEIVEYRKKSGLVDSRGRDLIEQDISELSLRLTEAKSNLSKAESRLEEFKGQSNNAPSVLSSPLIQRLREREAIARDDLAKLRDELGNAHPDIIAAKARLNAVTGQIQSEIKKISGGIDNEREVAAANVTSLEKNIEQLKQEYNESGEASVELQAMQREVETSRALLETLNLRLKQTQSQVDDRLQEANAVVISRASVPTDPSSPNILLILLGSIVTGLGLGIAVAIAKDQFEDTVFNGRQLQRMTRTTNIALVPKTEIEDGSGMANLSEFPIKAPYSMFTESIRSISTFLRLYMEKDTEARMFNFTSVSSNEGKSTVVASLARQMASEGMKVLVIDCDIRQPMLTRTFNLEGKHGLTDMLNQDCSFADALHRDPLSGMHLMGTGTNRDSNVVSRGNAVWQESRQKFLQFYDIVLLDSPPLLAISETKLLASSAKNIVCVRWKKTQLKQIQFMLDTLKRLNCTLVGTVVTFVDMKRSSVYNMMDQKYYNAPEEPVYLASEAPRAAS